MATSNTEPLVMVWDTPRLLGHLSDEDLQDQVRSFAKEHDLLEEIDMLQKGAMIIKYQEGFESGGHGETKSAMRRAKLTKADLDILRKEGRWSSQPWILYFTVALNSTAALVQGWDQTGINGANLLWPIDLLDLHDYPDYVPIIGLVNAAPYIIISLFACWISDPLNHWLGRRRTIWIGACFSFAAPLGSAYVQTWQQLLACRFLLGIGMGLKEVTVPILSAEIAPREIRGALVMSWQIFTAAGIFCGCAANLASSKIGKDYIFSGVGPNIWRFQLGSAFIPAVPLLLGTLLCPESPRWLIKKKMIREAYKSLQTLRGNKILAARDLYYIRELLERHGGERTALRDAPRRFKRLFVGEARIRRATFAASIVMITQQLCGINVLAFYSSSVFIDLVEPGLESSSKEDSEKNWILLKTTLWFTLGFGALNFLGAWPAFLTIDRIGRRALLLFTLPMMFLSLLVAGIGSKFPIKNGTREIVVIFMVYLFTLCYSPGAGPIAFTYSAEVFPMSHREIGMSWAVAMNNIFGAGLSLAFPKMNEKIGILGTLSFFAGMNILAWVLVFFFVPETRVKSLENLDDTFACSTGKHIRHQVFKVLPWLWQYMTLQKPGRCPEFCADREDEGVEIEDMSPR